jgi:hypothetical protein
MQSESRAIRRAIERSRAFRALRATFFALGITLLSGLSSQAHAGSLQIQFTGLNLSYDGSGLFDSAFPNTSGSGNPAESDVLTSMSFYLDGVQVGSLLSSNIFADVYLAGITNIPVGGGVVNSTGNGGTFGFDLLTENNVPGWGLALNVDTMQFFYTGSKIAVAVSGLASGLFAQALPFDLAYDPSEPITIVVASAELTNVTSAGGFLTGFNAGSTGNVAGVGFLVPEPGSATLLAAGGLATALGLRRRRRANKQI